MKYWIALILLLVSAATISAQTDTITPMPEATEDIISTPDAEVTPLMLEPLLNLPLAPPITIDLPEDWLYGYDTLVYTDIDGRVSSVPFALYTGPVTGGTGTIVLLWGFDSVVNPFSGQGSPNLWLDGLRLLRLIIFDATCNIGTAPQRAYTIGAVAAVGTQFSAVDCPAGQPDTRGWFASARVDEINFVFYVYIDPLQPAGTPAEFDLQAILDTVEFHVEDLLVTQEEFALTQQAFLTDMPLPESTAEATPEATEPAGG